MTSKEFAIKSTIFQPPEEVQCSEEITTDEAVMVLQPKVEPTSKKTQNEFSVAKNPQCAEDSY